MKLPLLSFLTFVSVVQSLPSFTATTNTNETNVNGLAPVPPGFLLIPQPGSGQQRVVNVAQASHLLLLVVLEAWAERTPALVPQQKEYADIDFPWSFLFTLVPQASGQYGNDLTAAWAAQKVVDAQLQAMSFNEYNWFLPQNGYQLQIPPLRIGVVAIIPSLSSDEGSSNAPHPPTVPLPPTQEVGTQEIATNQTNLQDSFYNILVNMHGRDIPTRAVIRLLFDYLASQTWPQNAQGRLARTLRPRSTYVSPAVDDVVLRITYLQMAIGRRRVTWEDVAQTIRFLLGWLSRRESWQTLNAVAYYQGTNQPFLRMEMQSPAVLALPHLPLNGTVSSDV